MITNFDLLHESIGSKLAKTAGIVGGGLIGLDIGDHILNAEILNFPTNPSEMTRNRLDIPVYKYGNIDAAVKHLGPERLAFLGAAGLLGSVAGKKIANKFSEDQKINNKN